MNRSWIRKWADLFTGRAGWYDDYCSCTVVMLVNNTTQRFADPNCAVHRG
jgi:hypothetical protein